MKKQNSGLLNTATIIRKKVSQLNDELLIASDELVEGSIEKSEKVQDMMAKILKNGTTLLGSQQELAIDAIQTMIGQYQSGNQRLRKLLGLKKYDLRKEKATQALSKVKNGVKAKTKAVAKKQKELKENIAKPKQQSIKVKVTKEQPKTVNADFTKLDGVGPKIAALLKEAGIQSYDKLAATKVDTLKEVLAKAGKRYATHDPTTWPRQAELAASGKWEVLKTWMAGLKKGDYSAK